MRRPPKETYADLKKARARKICITDVFFSSIVYRQSSFEWFVPDQCIYSLWIISCKNTVWLERSNIHFLFDYESILTRSMMRPFLIHHLQFDKLDHTSHIRIDQHDSPLYHVDWILLCLLYHLHVKWCKFSNEIYRLKWRRRKENECLSPSFSLSLLFSLSGRSVWRSISPIEYVRSFFPFFIILVRA